MCCCFMHATFAADTNKSANQHISACPYVSEEWFFRIFSTVANTHSCLMQVSDSFMFVRGAKRIWTFCAVTVLWEAQKEDTNQWSAGKSPSSYVYRKIKACFCFVQIFLTTGLSYVPLVLIRKMCASAGETVGPHERNSYSSVDGSQLRKSLQQLR